MKTYNETISEMNGKGFEMKQSISGYYYCIHNDEDGVERTVWMDSACEDAYDLETATAIAFGMCNEWEEEHPDMFADDPVEDEDENSGTNADEINFDNYFSPLQYLNIGYYIHGMVSVGELAKHLSLPTNVVKNIVLEIKLKPRLLKGKDNDFEAIMREFAIKVENAKTQNCKNV